MPTHLWKDIFDVILVLSLVCFGTLIGIVVAAYAATREEFSLNSKTKKVLVIIGGVSGAILGVSMGYTWLL